MATWPSGKAGACKALTTGSNPVVASKLFNPFSFREYICVCICAPRTRTRPHYVGCAAVPLFSRRVRRMCGSATFSAQEPRDMWQCSPFRAERAGCVEVPLFSCRGYHEGLRNEKGRTLSDAAPEIPVWWPHQDSNLEPVDYESIALTVAPWGRCAQASIIAENSRGNSYLLRDKVGASHIAKASVCPPLTHFGYFFIHARLDLKIIGSVGRRKL